MARGSQEELEEDYKDFLRTRGLKEWSEEHRYSQRLRARVLAEWRGLPETPFPKDTAKPVSETLAKLMKGLGLGERLNEEEVLLAWHELVGDFFAMAVNASL